MASLNVEAFSQSLKVLHQTYKRGLIETLIHETFTLFTNYEKLHRKIDTLKTIFKRNNYQQNVNQCI